MTDGGEEVLDEEAGGRMESFGVGSKASDGDLGREGSTGGGPAPLMAHRCEVWYVVSRAGLQRGAS